MHFISMVMVPNTVIRASDFHEVPGSADWLAAEFEFNQTFVPIGQARLIKNTKDVFHLAVINGGTNFRVQCMDTFLDFNESECKGKHFRYRKCYKYFPWRICAAL
jgi:hypothetical protein